MQNLAVVSFRSTAIREYSSALLGMPYRKRSFYDPKVRVNMMSKALADRVAPQAALTFSRKHLKWINNQIVECKGILRVVLLMMGNNKVFLDFHIFDAPGRR